MSEEQTDAVLAGLGQALNVVGQLRGREARKVKRAIAGIVAAVGGSVDQSGVPDPSNEPPHPSDFGLSSDDMEEFRETAADYGYPTGEMELMEMLRRNPRAIASIASHMDAEVGRRIVALGNATRAWMMDGRFDAYRAEVERGAHSSNPEAATQGLVDVIGLDPSAGGLVNDNGGGYSADRWR